MVDTFPVLCITYSVIWFLVVAYIVNLTNRLRKLERQGEVKED